MITSKHTFPKNEKLKSLKQIDLLFREGKSFFAAPVKCYYRIAHKAKGADESMNTQSSTLKAGVSVSKRNFKKSTDRNYIKRLLRESYRIHKHRLMDKIEGKPVEIELFFIYTDKTIPTFDLLEEKIKYAIRRLRKIVEELE